MKKCTYCGKEYSDEATVCPQDGEALVSVGGPGPPPLPAAVRAQGAAPASGIAVASMVLGILSLVLCVIGLLFGIPAVICGHIAQARAREAGRQGGEGFARAGLITGYIGIVAMLFAVVFVALPNYRRALRIECSSNLKQVGLATRIWSGDHNGALPNSFLEMSNELSNPKILICPADTQHTRPAAGTPAIWDPSNISYEFLTPGVPADKAANQVIIRCPIHGTELLGDGSVQFKSINR